MCVSQEACTQVVEEKLCARVVLYVGSRKFGCDLKFPFTSSRDYLVCSFGREPWFAGEYLSVPHSCEVPNTSMFED